MKGPPSCVRKAAFGAGTGDGKSVNGNDVGGFFGFQHDSDDGV